MKKFILFLVIVGLGVLAYVRYGHVEIIPVQNAKVAPVQPAVSAPVAKAPAGKAMLITGYAGASKMGMLDGNEAIKKILLERYGIEVKAIKKGGVDMVTKEPLDGIDFIWPASQVEVETYEHLGKPKVAVETLFASPMVLYTWTAVLDGLISKQYAFQDQGVYYVDGEKLFPAIAERKPWSDFGIPLKGSMKVTFSDPLKANSGLQYLLLAGTVLAKEEVLESPEKVIPMLRQMVTQQGMMTTSTGDIFTQYVQQGAGSKPIIAGYESQLIEFFLSVSEANANVIKQNLRVVYPQPTIWATHPMIAVTEKGRKLIKAFQDKEIQEAAWKVHGLRTMQSVADTNIDIGSKVPAQIQHVVNNPSTEIVNKVKEGLGHH